MNILYTLTAYPPSVGGAQIHTHKLLSELSRAHSIHVISHWDANRTDWLLGTTLRAPGSELQYTVDGIQVRRLGFTRAEKLGLIPYAALYYFLTGVSIAHISREIEKKMSRSSTYADLIHNIRIGREPISYASFNTARKKDIPFVFTPLHHPRWSGWLHRYYHRLYREADALIALTNAEKKKLVELGVDERKIYVTGIGPVIAEEADGDRFRAQHGLGQDPIILFLGQKYPYKGFEVLLKSAEIIWEKWNDARYVFVGPRTKQSEKVFSNLNDPRVVEIGSVDLQTKSDALAACTVFCLPSTQESFGGVYTEAWSYKRPVIGCDIPAVREVIDEGNDGFLSKQEPEEIADRIHSLLSSPRLAAKLGESGFQKVQDRYGWAELSRKTETVYATVSKVSRHQ